MKKILAVTVLFLLCFSFFAFGSISGNWKYTITFAPQTNSISAFSSRLNLNYSTGGVDFSSTSLFGLNDYTRQSFEVGMNPGLLELDSTISFYPPDQRLDYWSTTGDMVVAGLGIENTFLLEYVDAETGYGAGDKLVLTGELAEDVSIKISNYFGLEENLVELEGWQTGSGYDIALYGPNGERVSMLEYERTEVEIVGQKLGCCKFDFTSHMSAEEGFEFALFDFLIENETIPLSFDTRTTFTPDRKHLSLTPQLDLDWTCFSVYSSFVPETITSSNSEIQGFEIEGFGLNSMQVGDLTISSLTALGDGVLWKSKAAGSDIYLHAGDYVLDPDPIQRVFYKKVEYGYNKVPFDSIFSIEMSNDLYLGIDFYTRRAEDGNLFDIGLVTGEAEYSLSRQFTLGFGTSLLPDTGLDRIDLMFDYSF